MEYPQNAVKSAVVPKDFFLWGGAIIALYVSIGSFITLLFSYIDRAYPDTLTTYYTDPYSGTIRFAMASLIVLAPTLLVLFHYIRRDIKNDPGKANIWVRKWALVFTLFLSVVVLLVDLITLLNYFLDGDLTTRFVLKVLVVLLVSFGVFIHFLTDLKGYWLENTGKVKVVGVAVGILVFLSILSGFFIIGTPGTARLMRFDQQKVNDLQSIQSEITSYWQAKQTLPKSLEILNNPLQYYSVPVDPQTKSGYEYEVVSTTSFALCATFNKQSEPRTDGMAYPTDKHGGTLDTWEHENGRACFTRTIDPDFYKPFPLGTESARPL